MQRAGDQTPSIASGAGLPFLLLGPEALLRSYLFTLKNASRFLHPIHIHGHTFKVVRSSKQRLPVHHADTVLLLPEEEIAVAFAADNLGDWMLHCHVIEHQESGMMGYFRVV